MLWDGQQKPITCTVTLQNIIFSNFNYRMGCGTSINDNEVKSPSASHSQKQEVKSGKQENHGRFLSQRSKNVDLKQIKTQKSIMQGEVPPTNKQANNTTLVKQQQIPAIKHPNTRLYLFGESKQQRKIIQFDALPTPHIQILLSRTHNLPPVKYQPPQVILQQSQQLTSSNLYISTSHPPYNYMFATYIKNNCVFLCGGVNYGFDNVTNQAFLYYAKQEPININTPQKIDKASTANTLNTFKKQRRIGNNLMGSKFDRLAFMKYRRYSHMGVHYKAGKLGYIYVFGGRTQSDETLNKCEKYSIQENKWTDIAPMESPRSTGFALIVNKKIYVFGGYTREGKRSKKIQRYNPGFDSWDTLNIKLHKGIQTGILLPCPASNEILIVGGNLEFGAIKSVIRVNFQAQTYCWDSDLKKQRLLQKGLSILQQNIAYVFGGDFQDTIQKYSYKQKTWKILPNLTYGQCISPQDINAFTSPQQTIQLSWDTDNAAQNNAQTNKSQKQNHQGIMTGNYKYVFGTDDYPCIYQINTVKWVLKKKNVPMQLRLRNYMTVVKVREGKIFIAGGVDSYFEKPSKAAYIYYPGTNKAIEIAKMKQKKYAFAACCYQNYVYIFGGQDGKEGKVLSYAEKYSINEDKWIELPQMPQERTFCKALLTPNNKIMIIGGTDSVYQSVSRIEIFDPQADTFRTYGQTLSIASDVKFAEFTGDVVKTKVKKQSDQFQYLNESQLKLSSQIKIEGQKQNIENKSQLNSEQIEQDRLLIFGYNSFRKEDEAYQLSISLSKPDHLSQNEKSYKIFPYSLAFCIRSSPEQQKQVKEGSINKQQRIYYFISNKGVFKWQQTTKQMNSQIVINQMHMLQMPLDKFSVA